MSTTTRINLYRALAERLYLDKQEVVTGTATTTTGATTLYDTTRLKYTSGDANAYDRKYVYAMEAADASTRGFSRVTEGGYSGSAGTLGLSPDLTGLVTTDLYVITDHHPDALFAAIDAVQRNLYVPCFAPLSLHVCTSDDNDMETAPATSFLAGASNVTLVNETTIVKNGGQSLGIVASAAGGYTTFGTFGVNDGDLLNAGIDCYVVSGDSATFRIYDVTNSATVEDATTDEVKWMDLNFPFTVPSGCEQIYAQAICDANGDTAYWDDYQIWKTGTAVYELPSWITRPSQLIDFQGFPHGTGGPSSDNDYRTNERMSHPLPWGIERENIRANKPLLVWVNCTSARPYAYAYRPLAELATDSATTPAPTDTVVFWAEKLIREPEKASETLALLRATTFARPVTHLPRRVGVRIR